VTHHGQLEDGGGELATNCLRCGRPCSTKAKIKLQQASQKDDGLGDLGLSTCVTWACRENRLEFTKPAEYHIEELVLDDRFKRWKQGVFRSQGLSKMRKHSQNFTCALCAFRKIVSFCNHGNIEDFRDATQAIVDKLGHDLRCHIKDQ
jgi:hypothetical protein